MLHMRNLASGSSGNSTIFWTDSSVILVDAGLTALQIRRRVEDTGFDIEEIDAILISHEHTDHIRGIEILSRRYGIKIYANEGTWKGIEKSKSVKKGVENRALLKDDMLFGDIRVESFPVPHDATDPVGFRISSGSESAVIVTDIGHPTSYLSRIIRKSSVIVIESNHDIEMLLNGPYPYYLKQRILGPEGHLSNEDCGRALEDSIDGDKTVVLAHISEHNNTPELAEKTVRSHIGDGAELILTGRDPGPVLEM